MPDQECHRGSTSSGSEGKLTLKKTKLFTAARARLPVNMENPDAKTVAGKGSGKLALINA